MKPYSCDKCDESFEIFGLLKTHQASHTSGGYFPCVSCKLTFNSPQNLKRHRRTHHSGRAHLSCKECDKSYTTYANLKLHKRTHTGEKPYMCTHCTQSFKCAQDLKRHQSVHTGLKPFGCSLYNKHFSQTQLLNKHYKKVHNGSLRYKVKVIRKVYSGPFACSYCFKAFEEHS